ncbi:MAG: Ig-like domain-containing protein [Nanoarchaeota archaeon]
MNTNAKINIAFIIISIALSLVLFLYPLIIATTIASLNITTYGVGSGNQIINEDTQYTFNLTINHSGAGLTTRNLTGINVTLPSVFTFTNGTNGTGNISTTDGYATAGSITFKNFSDQLLSWNGTAATNTIVTMNATAGIVEGKNYTFIWFNASAATPGKYNITIRFLHNYTLTSTSINETNITIVVNDTTRPHVVNISNFTLFDGTQQSTSYANVSGRIIFNISAVDNGNFTGNTTGREINGINISFYNISTVINASYLLTNVTGFATGTYWNITVNTSTLPDGVYNITIQANDTLNNVNGTVNLTNIRIDNTAPSVTVTCSDTTSGSAFPCSCSSSDTTSGVKTTVDSSNSPDNIGTASNTGSFTYTCIATDYAGLSTTKTTTYSVSQSGGGGSSGGGGGGSSSTTTYTRTVSINQDFSKETSTTQQLGEKERIKIDIPAPVSVGGGTATHYVGVKDIKTNSVVIEITSTPIILEIAIGDEMKVDVNDDGAYDLKVTLNKIENNKAEIKIEYLQETVPEEEKEEVAETGGFVEEKKPTPTEEKSTLWIWITIIILTVIAIVVYIAVMMNKRKW